jgi:hypothetical protein
MTQPSPTSQEQTSGAEDSSSAPVPSRGLNGSSLSRDLADFLVEFSIVLHKRSMYPGGHPHLQNSTTRFSNRMNALLDKRASVTLGVARHRLVIETVTTDPNNALLRDLAHRLHRHRIASVQLSRGATLEEVESLLMVLSLDPQRGDGPIGRRLDKVGPWDHIKLRSMGFDKFTLQGSGGGGEPTTEGSAAERDAWVELARLALSTEQGEEPPSDADPLVVAHAIGQKAGEVAYDRVVLGYLSKVAEEMSGRKGLGEDQLGQRLSRMIQALDPDTLRRLLETGADQAGRRDFALNASQILAADAVMEVVEAAAKASKQTISHNLLRLLHKLAHHAEGGPATVRAEAEGALRTNVARLIGDWELEDPNPTRYTAILEGMVRKSPAEATDAELSFDPDIILRMASELGSGGPAVIRAVEALLARRELVRVTALLDTAEGPWAQEIWSYVATPERLTSELQATPLDQEAISILVKRIGAEATNSLLDRLTTADDRSTRATILKQLLGLGPDVGRLAVARLTDAPWYVQRNILLLIGRLGSWPEGFSPLSYATHADPRIRREALKLLLESEGHAKEGILLGLRDADDGIATLAATTALESCPVEGLALVSRLAADDRRMPELRALALRILARTRAPEALRLLLGLAVSRRRLFGRRLAPKSPVLLAALAGLASFWHDNPSAMEVLLQALQHSDPEIRAAAGGTAA